ncbi:MAG: polyphosphate kinase 2 [Aureispira sp.]
MQDLPITAADLEHINTKQGYLKLLSKKEVNVKKILATLKYEKELEQLQVELLKMQSWVIEQGLRVAIVFEGRDAAGKGGTIRRFVEHLIPRSTRIVALPKPTEEERGQWYFRRYINQLPNTGEVVFFDRSWYNRAVVEPVNGFCTEEQYERFMDQVKDVERMIQASGIILFKFWLDTSKEEQAERFADRKNSPLKQWKLSPIDAKAQELWEVYTQYRDAMFERTHSKKSPWVIVQADRKKQARLESIRYVLQQLEYSNKATDKIDLKPDSKVVQEYED